MALEKTKATHGKNTEAIRRREIRKLKRNMKKRERYAKDKCVSKQKKSHENQCYRQNVECRKRKMSLLTTRYQQDSNFRQRRKFYITNRYSQDMAFKLRQKSYITNRYSQNIAFKLRQKSYITNRYSQDIAFKKRQRSRINSSYRLNAHFRLTRKSYITNRYANNPEFRAKQKQTMRQLMKNKYHAFKMTNNMRCALNIRQKYRWINRQRNPRDDSQHMPRDESLIREAIKVFRLQIKKGPTYVCTVCHRALFPNQVKCCNRSNYVTRSTCCRNLPDR